MESGECFELNRVGSEIWDLLASGSTMKSICETLLPRYVVSEEMLRTDVQTVLEDLVRRGLISAGVL